MEQKERNKEIEKEKRENENENENMRFEENNPINNENNNKNNNNYNMSQTPPAIKMTETTTYASTSIEPNISLLENAETLNINKHTNNENMSYNQYIRYHPDFVNVVRANEFIEAPQWVAHHLNPEEQRFEVGFRTLTDCVYIKWPRENLVQIIDSNPRIKNALQAILGVYICVCVCVFVCFLFYCVFFNTTIIHVSHKYKITIKIKIKPNK